MNFYTLATKCSQIILNFAVNAQLPIKLTKTSETISILYHIKLCSLSIVNFVLIRSDYLGFNIYVTKLTSGLTMISLYFYFAANESAVLPSTVSTDLHIINILNNY